MSLSIQHKVHTMARADTSQRSEFIIANEGGAKFPVPSGSSPEVALVFFVGSKRATGLHWHETHTELVRVAQGAACLETDGFVRVITERDGIVLIQPGVRHQYWRADRDACVESEDDRLLGVAREELERDLVIMESTEPADRDKEVFFRQILSLLEEMRGNGVREIAWMLWSSFVVFYGHDNYPVVVKVTRRFGERLGKTLEWVITHSILTIAAILGRFVGLRSTYDEYTPFELRKRVAERTNKIMSMVGEPDRKGGKKSP